MNVRIAMTMMKRKYLIVLLCMFALTSAGITVDASGNRDSGPGIKYVFYMIGDGMGINLTYGAEFYNRATGKGPENLNFLNFPVVTMVATSSSGSLVTDSAAAGTALATGHKTRNWSLGVDADMAPVSNIAEWAKACGYGTGVATSVGINHATPSAFYSHMPSRDMYSEIIAAYVEGELDFLAGAGINYNRKNGPTSDEMEKMIMDSGITVLKGTDMERSEDVQGRLLCMSGTRQSDLPFAIDQDEYDTNLSDFVDAGIEYLDAHYGDKGFFFMIEGGRIDYAAHANDPVATFHEINDFAAAIDLVMEFYNEHPEETLIVVTSDHDTGGMSPGRSNYSMDVSLLAWQSESIDALSGKFLRQFDGREFSFVQVKAFLSDNLGLWSHVPVDEGFERHLLSIVDEMKRTGAGKEVKNLYSVNTEIVYDAVIYLGKAAGFNWTHQSHTGSPVGLYVLGPGAEAFNACRDNTDIPMVMAAVAGYDNVVM